MRDMPAVAGAQFGLSDEDMARIEAGVENTAAQ